MGGNGFGYVFILPNRPHADTDLICVVGVIDLYTLTLRHQSLREEKKENRTVILTFVVLRKD